MVPGYGVTYYAKRNFRNFKLFSYFNPFKPNDSFLYPLKTSKYL